MRTCVIGVGNELRRDDGIGPLIIEQLRKMVWKTSTDLFTLGPDLFGLGRMAGSYDLLFVLDALPPGPEPGKVTVIRWETAACRKMQVLSLHDMDLMMQLNWARRECMKEIWLIGVETASDDWGIGLSPEMQEVMASLVERVYGVIQERLSHAMLLEGLGV